MNRQTPASAISCSTRLSTFVALLVCLAVQSSSAWAEVSEVLSYRYYNATPQANESLRQGLDRTSTIRENGRQFWGHAAWHVTWDFRWAQQNGGRCTLNSVRTRLNATITMPQMVLNEPATQKVFDRFTTALRSHELGHVDIARNVAREIDQRLLKMPTMATCYELERSANALGERLLNVARQRGLQYDEQTQHGRSEGATLAD